jgi:microcystin degradation protein MlrC
MLTLIKTILKSIELYLSLKNKLFYIELRNNHEKTRKRIIQEIEDLRSSGGDADRADLLRDELIREDSNFQHLSAFYTELEKGGSSKHK